ncbi:hypothetical protein [Methylobacterium symbioticum]|uniref:Uncharacterized protein n=1 Tax=Methylobacterium symbioticum TaxID=2584084 RepID=A0A509EFN8_9HYPH|nr:hypothetical protein MET9862_03477 [Methylobacterium symbioticum]
MRQLLAVAVLLGATVGAGATEIPKLHPGAFDGYSAATGRAKARPSKRKPHPAKAIDTRRYDDGLAAGKPDHLRLGYRNGAGLYVPPDYSTNPRGPRDGFGGPISEPSSSFGSAPTLFNGPLGTRR